MVLFCWLQLLTSDEDAMRRNGNNEEQTLPKAKDAQARPCQSWVLNLSADMCAACA